MKKYKIAIASDHGGFELKNKIFNHLIENGYEIKDFGTNSSESCDYPDFAKIVVNEILNNNFDKGILVCGTGIGMAICANRFRGIRAANFENTFSARMSVEHNNSNILTLGQRVLGDSLAFEIVDTWLGAEFQAGRHLKRNCKLDE